LQKSDILQINKMSLSNYTQHALQQIANCNTIVLIWLDWWNSILETSQLFGTRHIACWTYACFCKKSLCW